MNTLETTTTVGQLVAERPSRSRVFERHGIDFCCGGGQTLAEACSKRGLDPNQILSELEDADASTAETEIADWSSAPLADLIDHILGTHHAYLRNELPRLSAMVLKVAEVHGERHPELARVQSIFATLRQELVSHMMKEEQILFPGIKMLEGTADDIAVPFCGVQGPVRVMILEHENAGDALGQLRALTGDYTAPDDGCNTYRAMLDGLRELEADLHMHIHKENNILFPRALELESAE